MSRRALLISVFGAALLLRLSFLFWTFPSEGWDTPGISKGAELGRIAANLAEGKGFSSPFRDGSTPTAWFAPFVPALWAAVFRVFGVYSEASLLCLLALQSVAASLSTALFTSIADRLWRNAGGRTMWFPAILGFLLCAWPESLLVHARVWYFVWQELALVILLTCCWRWIEAPTARRAAAVGIAAGLGGLVNPVPITFLAWAWLIAIKSHRVSTKTILQHIVGMLLLTVVLFTPWMLRNLRQMDAFLPLLRPNFGIELWQGNNPQGSVMQTRNSLHPMLRKDEEDKFHELGEIEYARQKGREAKSYILSHPGTTALRTADRLQLFWLGDVLDRHSWQPDSKPWWQERPWTMLRRLVRITLTLVPLLIGIAGLFSRSLRTIPGVSLILGILVVAPLPYYLTHVNPLYSYVVKPYVVLLAGLFVAVILKARCCSQECSLGATDSRQ